MEFELKEKYDVLLKLIIIGDSSVGKTCILNSYLKNNCKYLYKTILYLNSFS